MNRRPRPAMERRPGPPEDLHGQARMREILAKHSKVNAGAIPAEVSDGEVASISKATPSAGGETNTSSASIGADASAARAIGALHWKLSEDQWSLESTNGLYVVRKRVIEPAGARSEAIHGYRAYRVDNGVETLLAASTGSPKDCKAACVAHHEKNP